jgi:hypothetical protein
MKRVFISYSHKDLTWLERLQRHLRPLERPPRLIELWDDTGIPRGSYWNDQIQAALEAADVAILLVSADFFASDFIADRELPLLLKRAAAGSVVILPVIIGPSQFGDTPGLAQLQAVNPPSKPLVNMTVGEQEQVFDDLTRLIRRLDDSTPKPQQFRENPAPPNDPTLRLIILGGVILLMLLLWSWFGPSPGPPSGGPYTPSSQYGQPAPKR